MYQREIGDLAGRGGCRRSSLSLQERVGNFLADFYSVNGLVLESRKRREHLSEEDILRNKAIMESLSKGGNLIEQNFEVSLLCISYICSFCVFFRWFTVLKLMCKM